MAPIRDPAVEQAFDDYIRGRTVALVGPAVPLRDQRAEVDAHDVVYRVGVHGDHHPLYGTRADVGIVNSQKSRRISAGQHLDRIRNLDWLIHKAGAGEPPVPHRRAHLPVGTPNLATIALHDLTFFGPASVTVFGVDFFLGGPATCYYGPYKAASGGYSFFDVRTNSTRVHDQQLQRRIIRRIRAEKGWPRGDDRFDAALELDDVTFDERWRAAWWAEGAKEVYETHG